MEVTSCVAMKQLVVPVPQIEAETSDVIQLGLMTKFMKNSYCLLVDLGHAMR